MMKKIFVPKLHLYILIYAVYILLQNMSKKYFSTAWMWNKWFFTAGNSKLPPGYLMVAPYKRDTYRPLDDAIVASCHCSQYVSHCHVICSCCCQSGCVVTGVCLHDRGFWQLTAPSADQCWQTKIWLPFTALTSGGKLWTTTTVFLNWRFSMKQKLYQNNRLGINV